MDDKIEKILSQKLTKKEKEKVKNEFLDQWVFRGFLTAAELLVFEITHRESGYQPEEMKKEVISRLIQFIRDPGVGLGYGCSDKLVCAGILKRLEKIPLNPTSSHISCLAWQLLRKVFIKMGLSDQVSGLR